MSLITRCPACGTYFKVVADQLRISDGWVRCGRCSKVFDAALDLRESLEVAAPAPSKASDNKTAAAQADAPLPAAHAPARGPDRPERQPLHPGERPVDLRPAGITLPAGIEPPLHGLVADEPWPTPAPGSAQAAQATAVMPNSSASKPPWRSQVPPEAPAGEQASHSAIRQARAETATRARVPDKESDIAPPAVPQPTDEPAVEGPTSASDLPSFLQEPAGRWRRRGGRRMQPRARKRTAMIGALLLLGLLVLQVLRHERDVLAARQPGLRPLLTQLCAVTGCTVATLRRIGSITVDGATFARERIGDGFRLNFTLRNDAATALAMPAIELSLLDTQQRAVVRRVIGPAEFGAPPELGARAERAASLALAISGTGAAALPPVAGYRVIAFYP